MTKDVSNIVRQFIALAHFIQRPVILSKEGIINNPAFIGLPDGTIFIDENQGLYTYMSSDNKIKIRIAEGGYRLTASYGDSVRTFDIDEGSWFMSAMDVAILSITRREYPDYVRPVDAPRSFEEMHELISEILNKRLFLAIDVPLSSVIVERRALVISTPNYLLGVLFNRNRFDLVNINNMEQSYTYALTDEIHISLNIAYYGARLFIGIPPFYA